MNKEALFYRKHENKKIICELCPHSCIIDNNHKGKCRVRKNIDGRLITLNYGKVTAYHLDPIEKKPLFHFHPGEYIFSLGTYGCNLKCYFCQNHSIAHESPNWIITSSEDIVDIACKQVGNIGMAYTYNEPSIWYEFILDIARLLKERGKKNVLVTNGFINKEPIQNLLQYIDAMNIDLKGFNNKFYNYICGGKIAPVLDTIKLASNYCHVEITTLLIEGLNTDEKEIINLCKWIGEIDRDIPLHLTRYYPAYKMDLPATSVEVIKNLRETAKKYLNFVYIGNVIGVDNNTYCPSCNTLIVDRSVRPFVKNLKDGLCGVCGKKIKIVV